MTHNIQEIVLKDKRYKWIYIICIAIFTGIVLNKFTFYLNFQLGWEHQREREFFISFGQIIWQMTAIYFLDKNKILAYLVNMSSVSLLGTLLLLPILLVNNYVTFSLLGLIFSFGVIVSIMLFEHMRRCKLLNISISMTISWMIYRTTALAIILALSI